MHQLCSALQSLFLQKNVHIQAYTSPDQLVCVKKRIERVHHGRARPFHVCVSDLTAQCYIPVPNGAR